MDPSTDINQDPLAAGDTGATSFAPDFDMSAINEAVAAGGESSNIQNSFDVNDINLENTPTSDAELEQQLKDEPNMSLANSADSNLASAATEPTTPPVAGFVDGDLTDEPVATDDATASTPPADINSDPLDGFEAAVAAATPDDAATPAETPVESLSAETPAETPAEETPAEPATIADLANAANDPTITEAPDAVPPSDIQPSEAKPANAAAEAGKSKAPTYILVALAIVAVTAVIIALFVSLA
jgi:hypothetical protein